jgi:hypothetical protein
VAFKPIRTRFSHKPRNPIAKQVTNKNQEPTHCQANYKKQQGIVVEQQKCR